jgi:hypothetical protein
MPARKVPRWNLPEFVTSKVVLKSKYNSTAFRLFSQGVIFKVFHMHSLLFIKRTKLIGAGVRDFYKKRECLEATFKLYKP